MGFTQLNNLQFRPENTSSGNIALPIDRAMQYGSSIKNDILSKKELLLKQQQQAIDEDRARADIALKELKRKELNTAIEKRDNGTKAIKNAMNMQLVSEVYHDTNDSDIIANANKAYEALSKSKLSDAEYTKQLELLNSELRSAYGGSIGNPYYDSKSNTYKDVSSQSEEWSKALDKQSKGFTEDGIRLDSKATRDRIFNSLLDPLGYDKATKVTDDIMRKRFGGLTPEQIKNSKDEITKIFDKKMALLGSSSANGNGGRSSSSAFNGRVTTTDTNSYKLLKESIEDLGLDKHKTHTGKAVDKILDYKPSQDDIWDLVKAVKLSDPTISDSQIAETLPIIINKNGWFRDAYFKDGMSKSEILPIFMSLINKNAHNTVKRVGYDITGDDGTVRTVSKADLGNIYTREYLRNLAAINKNSKMHMDGEKSTTYNSSAADFFKNYKVPKEEKKKITETKGEGNNDVQQPTITSTDFRSPIIDNKNIDYSKDRVTNIQGNNKYDIIDQARELYNNGDITSDEYYKAVKSVSNHYGNYDNSKASFSDGTTTELPLVNKDINYVNKEKALNYRQAYLNYLLGKGPKPTPPEFIIKDSKTDRSLGINMLPPKGSSIILDNTPDSSGTKQPSIGDLNKQFDNIRGLLNSQGSN